ncbi:LPS export ABC transporter periplasmic protein LptC [Ferruginibacter paludis]|uniref:LPS export ABC transporter periplasmic protein LptC n=1 Tax=Ferruginibacter paludis TaxID=1310417 RepID=UPI0025B45150|nr:LPS export ABC transporter periplasmic protein LptC [Ferruginibacter paludis]MDN3659327.1 LPS export ABC transporter periplasmic protein LptC [Ferruginibacter paludis]
MNYKDLYIPILAAVFAGCFFLCSCENTQEELDKFNHKDIAVEEGKNVVIKYSVGGRKKAILTGPVMYRVQDTIPYIEFPKSIHVDFFDIRDSLDSKLDAKYAQYKETQSRVFLKDSVRVINVKGDTLYCNELYWDRARTGTEFYTDKPVRIRTRKETLDGIGMEASQDFKEYHIIKPTGIVSVPAAQFPN